jgi:hypothetical protein
MRLLFSREEDDVKITFLPTTTLGKWTVGLIISLILFFLLAIAIIILAHQTGGETFTAKNYIAIPMLLVVMSGVSAFITGLIAILKYKERTLLVFLATFIGLNVLIFLLGEFLVPH